MDPPGQRDEEIVMDRIGGASVAVILALAAALVPGVQSVAAHNVELDHLEISLVVVANSTAEGRFLFEPSEIVIYPPPVFVNVTLINGDFGTGVRHNWTIVVNDTFYQTPLIGPGEVGYVEFWINSTGEYPFWCAVPGHRDLGMEGLIRVSAAGAAEEGPTGQEGIPLRAYWIGLIGIFSMIVVIIVGYFVIKYESRHHRDHGEHKRRGLP